MNNNAICFPNTYPLYWIVDDPLDSAIPRSNNQGPEMKARSQVTTYQQRKHNVNSNNSSARGYGRRKKAI